MSEFHHHVRDELEAVIARDAHRCDVDARTVANRCVHTLVLLGVLPETDAETTPAAGDLVTRLRRWRNVASAVDAHEAADEIERLRAEIERLRVLLAQANDAFDECTGDYSKKLVADEPWRQYGGSDE